MPSTIAVDFSWVLDFEGCERGLYGSGVDVVSAAEGRGGSDA